MKKLVLSLMLVLFVFVGMTFAADKELNGQQFYISYGSTFYQFDFVKGPFGPDEYGTVFISDTANSLDVFECDYMFDGNFSVKICAINFIYVDIHLIQKAENGLTISQKVE